MTEFCDASWAFKELHKENFQFMDQYLERQSNLYHIQMHASIIWSQETVQMMLTQFFLKPIVGNCKFAVHWPTVSSAVPWVCALLVILTCCLSHFSFTILTYYPLEISEITLFPLRLLFIYYIHRDKISKWQNNISFLCHQHKFEEMKKRCLLFIVMIICSQHPSLARPPVKSLGMPCIACIEPWQWGEGGVFFRFSNIKSMLKTKALIS